MTKLILFFFLWFIDGVLIYAIDIENGAIENVLLTVWIWTFFCGMFYYNKRFLSFYSSRLKWIKD
jgi:hypothetical protein